MTRKTAFLLITILLPPFVFAVAEVALRSFGFGEDLRLVVEMEVSGRRMYSINRRVAQRYFAGGGTDVPEPSEDIFSLEKRNKTIRIFCLGESTMAGFPYELNATAPALLKRELSAVYPEYDFEVINVGLAAVGTFVVRDFLDELLDFDPDLFVVYVGHNEFYGIYGPASSVGTTIAPWITELSISLTRFKVYLALRDLLSVEGTRTGDRADRTLMEQVASRQAIAYKSDIYELARTVYRRNVESLINSAREAGVPIMFSTVVSNVADQPPFLSAENASLTPALADEFARRLSRTDSMSADDQVSAYQSALALDSLHAGAWFGLGRAYAYHRDSTRALRCLSRARDLDALRFRMSEEFQEELRQVCRIHDVPLSPADSVFAVFSPLGLVGHELILEHVHPNLGGYALLARTWARTIVQSSLLGLPGTADSTIVLTPKTPETVTAFDTAVGSIRTTYLMHRWPFPEDRTFSFSPANPVEDIALRYVRKKIPWQVARYEAASYYAGQKRFDLARREALAVASVIPFSYEPLLRVADYYVMEGRREEAEGTYRKCAQVEANPYAWSKLALLLVESEEFNEAVLALNNAFAAEGKTAYRLPVEAVISNRYLLGYAYAKLQKRTEAIRELKRVLVLDPHHKGALELIPLLEGRR